MPDARVISVHVGKVAPLGPDRVPSAFVKSSIEMSVSVSALGLQGDEQADLSVHGGLEKAVYGYAFDHYALWQREYPEHVETLLPGGFGENLCIQGMQEADLCVGDVHRIGGAILQVCQPRQPCFKLALHFDDKLMPRAMVKSGRSGWYYRVLETGTLAAQDSVRLLERPNPHFSFARLVQLISFGKATVEELVMMQEMPGLASDWQARAREVLAGAP